MDHLGAVLDQPAPPAGPEEAAALARDAFGLDAEARPLTGERDRNFRLTTAAGRDYALRIIHPAEPAEVSDFQSRALLHVAEAAPDLPVPRLHWPRGGAAPEALWTPPGGGPACRVRLLDYLPGRPLYQAAPGPAQRGALGAMLARLDQALAGFRHPGEGHALMWDIQHALRLRPLLAQLPDAADRALADDVLARFERHAVPLLPGLRPQVIHNDFNPHNILTDPADDRRITGIIDFGDMVRAPMVQDLATAAAYQVAAEGHPLEGPAQLARAFHAVCPLWPEEVEILADLIATRLAVAVTISGWRAAKQPENAPYILRNYPRSLSGLRRLGALGRAEAQSYFREALSA
ncbi:phosphotransferase [Pseudoroseomonas cervicalis]|uniref:phosphotransferase n=1 Tax=Teichococcus cervicalis TaxID=204525 RepID=UPI0022F1588C|nr:phosphotransferase [Pseudoroseomonas cervicalis]WBV41393.1 phosphotransferase [Pseudoroseomonas cervicalis]